MTKSSLNASDEAHLGSFSRNVKGVNKESEVEQNGREKDRFFLKKIVVTGNTVLHTEIEEIIQPFENQEIIFEDILRVRSMLTELYISKGYITSGAFLPDAQDITSGIVQFEVIDGEIERIDITVSGRLARGYIDECVRLGIGKPFNQKDLRSAL